MTSCSRVIFCRALFSVVSCFWPIHVSAYFSALKCDGDFTVWQQLVLLTPVSVDQADDVQYGTLSQSKLLDDGGLLLRDFSGDFGSSLMAIVKCLAGLAPASF